VQGKAGKVVEKNSKERSNYLGLFSSSKRASSSANTSPATPNTQVSSDDMVLTPAQEVVVERSSDDPARQNSPSEQGDDALSLHESLDCEDALRRAFLRVFVFLYQGYQRFIVRVSKDGNMPDSLFDKEGFLRSAEHLPESFHGTMHKFMTAQMFERFLQDAITQPDRAEVVVRALFPERANFFSVSAAPRCSSSTNRSPRK
jgi:hypothetical protein